MVFGKIAVNSESLSVHLIEVSETKNKMYDAKVEGVHENYGRMIRRGNSATWD